MFTLTQREHMILLHLREGPEGKDLESLNEELDALIGSKEPSSLMLIADLTGSKMDENQREELIDDIVSRSRLKGIDRIGILP